MSPSSKSDRKIYPFFLWTIFLFLLILFGITVLKPLLVKPKAVRPFRGGGQCIGKVCFAQERKVGEVSLKLRGVTLRRYLVVNIYTGALYLSDAASKEKWEADEPRALVMRYHYKVSREKVIESVMKDLRSIPGLPPGKMEKLAGEMLSAFEPTVPGDEYEYQYIPGKGTSMIKDGRVLATIPGKDFADALFGVWLSPYVEDQKIRKELLGL